MTYPTGVSISSNNPIFVSNSVSSCSSNSLSSQRFSGVQFGQNVGIGEGDVYKDVLSNVIRFRTLKSSDSSVDISTVDDEVDLKVGAGTNDLNYYIEQVAPVSLLVINHSLNKNPSVTVTDSLGVEIFGDVVHVSVNQVQVEFSEAITFNVYVN